MTTDERIRKEYDRQRGLVIKELESIAKTMLNEAEVLKGTDYVPMAHWRSMMRSLEQSQDAVETLRHFYVKEG